LLGIILNAPLKIKDYLRKISNTRRPLFVIHKSKIISEKEGLEDEHYSSLKTTRAQRGINHAALIIAFY
jgi:hypothetical protein